MARINIDEKWKTDPRRTKLANRIGGRAADGMLVEITWLIWSHRGLPIPLKEFEFVDNYQDWIDCGLARVELGLVHIAGADRYQEFFDKQKVNAAKGGKAKAAQKKPKLPKAAQTKPGCPSISISVSSSISSSSSDSSTDSGSCDKSAADKSAAPVEGEVVELSAKALIAKYCDLWKARYKSTRSPDIRGKQAGQLKGLGEELGYPRAFKLVEAYFQMDDAWFITKTHDIDTLLGNPNKVALFADSGKMITRRETQQIDNASALANQMKKYGAK